MYSYDQHDQKIVDQRVTQFRDQTTRYLAGELSEEQFLPLRLQNGLYIQRLAPMLRIAGQSEAPWFRPPESTPSQFSFPSSIWSPSYVNY